MKEVLIVIPARYASTRFPAKVLAPILGKPMIWHVWNAVKGIDYAKVIVACDDLRVKDAVEAFGGEAVLTPSDLNSGTERVAYVCDALPAEQYDIVVNVQADEPMLRQDVVETLISVLANDPDAYMATLCSKIKAPEELDNPNVVKVIIDANNYAIYFSRSLVPYPMNKMPELVHHKHIGIYGFRPWFLRQYVRMPSGILEHSERLEQLRVIEQGFRIKVGCVDYNGVAVDMPDDIVRVESLMEKAKA